MLHYQLVRCNTCGLVRSDPVAGENILGILYQQSTFTYSQDIPNLRKTYGQYLRKADKYLPQKGHILEIGCGNGFFLEEALAQGFAQVSGIEPSQDAINLAQPAIQPRITCNMMGPGAVPQETFDMICLFQTFDHISEPGILLEECHKALKPGGLILCFNHNVEALSARLLKEKSPIVDIEHTYLYSPKTIRQIFEKNGYETLEVGPAWNTIRLYSLLRLFPFPRRIKQKVLDFVDGSLLREARLTLPLGNLYIIARKVSTR